MFIQQHRATLMAVTLCTGETSLEDTEMLPPPAGRDLREGRAHGNRTGGTVGTADRVSSLSAD